MIGDRSRCDIIGTIYAYRIHGLGRIQNFDFQLSGTNAMWGGGGRMFSIFQGRHNVRLGRLHAKKAPGKQ